MLVLSHFSRVQLFATSWIVAPQAPRSMGSSAHGILQATGGGSHVFPPGFDHYSLSSDLLFLLSIFYAPGPSLGTRARKTNEKWGILNWAITSHFKKLSGRNREERDNQSTEALPRIGFVMSRFWPITVLIEPSIILSTYIFSLEETRHKMLYMEPEADTVFWQQRFPDDRQIIKRKKKSRSDAPGKWHLSNPEPDFGSNVPGLAAWRGHTRTLMRAILHKGSGWGSRSRQTIMFQRGFSRLQLHPLFLA